MHSFNVTKQVFQMYVFLWFLQGAQELTGFGTQQQGPPSPTSQLGSSEDQTPHSLRRRAPTSSCALTLFCIPARTWVRLPARRRR